MKPQPQAAGPDAIPNGESDRLAGGELAQPASREVSPSKMLPLARGRLRVYLGYAAGTGKTFQMLTDGHALRAQGHDVVIGYFEPHARPATIALTEGLEFVPNREIIYRGVAFREMDTEAIVRRRPEICMVDEFAHTNIPGSPREKRWQDVLGLLETGINVLTTMNVQHLESLNDEVFQVSGIRVRETIPDWVIGRADEVVMVDVTPEALLNRLARGVVYPKDRAELAMRKFFKEPTLVTLREFALRQTAHEVEIRQPGDTAPGQRPGEERILVVLTEDPGTVAVIRRARRVADHLQAPCMAVAVSAETVAAARERLEKHLSFARDLHLETFRLNEPDTAAAVVAFARRQRITQIFVSKPSLPRRWPWSPASLAETIVRQAHDMQVTLVAGRRPTEPARTAGG